MAFVGAGKHLQLRVALSGSELSSVLRGQRSRDADLHLDEVKLEPPEGGEPVKTIVSPTAPARSRERKHSDLVASFSTSLDQVTLSGKLHERFPIHFTLKPRTRTYENFIRFMVRELQQLSSPEIPDQPGERAAQAEELRALEALTKHLESKLRDVEREARRSADEISDFVEVFSDDLEPTHKKRSRTNGAKNGSSPEELGASEERLRPSRRVLLRNARSVAEQRFRFVNRSEQVPRLISGFLSLEIEEVAEPELDPYADVPVHDLRAELLRQIRIVSKPSIEVRGDSAHLQLKITVDPELAERMTFVVHWGSYQRGSGPWVDEEVSAAERQIAGTGEISLRKLLTPEQPGFYGATIFFELGGERRRISLSELGFGDVTFNVEREEGDIQLHTRREALVEQKELEALLLRSLASFDLFVRAVNQLAKDHTIRGLGFYLFTASNRDSGLRRLLGDYYQRAIIELGSGPSPQRARRLKTVLAVMQNLGIGEIVFVAPEGPHAIAGGLAQVVVGLPSALSRFGIATTVITPLYEESQGNKHRSAEEVIRTGIYLSGERVALTYLGEVKIPIGPTYASGTADVRSRPRIVVAQVYEARRDRERIIFLRHPRLADRLYSAVDAADQLRRAVFLSRGSLEVMRAPRFGVAPHIIVTNDWVSALVPPLLRCDPRYSRDVRLRKVETLHVLHNCGRDYQGRFYTNQFGEDLWPIIGLSGEHYFGLSDPQDRSHLNLTAGAVYHSQKGILAVSRPYAQQLMTDEGGEGLDPLFRAKRDVLFGISNGVDLQALRRTFLELGERAEAALNGDAPRRRARSRDLIDKLVHQKQVTKSLVQRRLGLAVDDGAVLISLVGRLAEQKGIQLLTGRIGATGVSLLETILRRHPDVQFLVGGPPSHGDPAMEDLAHVVKQLEERLPARIRGVFSFIPHQEALELTLASDLFLMPSRYEPGGITQLEALSCGTPVIARRVGGIAATLLDYSVELDRGNSFLFYEYSSSALFAVMERALGVMSDATRRRALIAQSIRAENDWSHRVPRYLTVFQQVAGVLDQRRSYPYLASRHHLLHSVRVD